VPTHGVTSSRPVFEEKGGKKERDRKREGGERNRETTERNGERERRERKGEGKTERERPEIGAGVTSLPPISPQQPCQSRG